jgi:predicted ATPase
MKIKRLSISKYKSIRSFEIDDPPDLLVFIGKNNGNRSLGRE